jgi:microtubule-associated protein-like 1/2
LFILNFLFTFQDGGNLLVAVDEGQEHTLSVWDWQRGERGTKITETKVKIG